MSESFVKDPEAVLDYLFDWSEWLAADGDTITDHTVTVSTGLTLASSTRTTTAVTVWLSGGTLGQQYTVDCRITTTLGRTASRKMTFLIQDR
ncbi:hypothetical protein [uncultured Ruegeria sp.]|uniref:phage fiber-tail adaptor protein n=1 Tax=uncultured Ruegeria sp. TaxID=259304 RepID=UPI002618F30E|nr:hypothetical protein [uncultured Ruegeria sp.]